MSPVVCVFCVGSGTGEAGGAARVLETTEEGGGRKNKPGTEFFREIFGTLKSISIFHWGMTVLIALNSLLNAIHSSVKCDAICWARRRPGVNQEASTRM